MNKTLLINSCAIIVGLGVLTGCGFFSGNKTDVSSSSNSSGSMAPVNSNLELKESRGVSTSNDSNSNGLFTFNGSKNNGSGTVGIGVNSYLWRATLDTLSFLPLVSADPFGGVIITDWYEDPKAKGERFKVNAFITDKVLRVDALKITVFKQRRDEHGVWRDIEVSKEIAGDLEDTILTRAREMRMAGSSK